MKKLIVVGTLLIFVNHNYPQLIQDHTIFLDCIQKVPGAVLDCHIFSPLTKEALEGTFYEPILEDSKRTFIEWNEANPKQKVHPFCFKDGFLWFDDGTYQQQLLPMPEHLKHRGIKHTIHIGYGYFPPYEILRRGGPDDCMILGPNDNGTVIIVMSEDNYKSSLWCARIKRNLKENKEAPEKDYIWENADVQGLVALNDKEDKFVYMDKQGFLNSALYENGLLQIKQTELGINKEKCIGKDYFPLQSKGFFIQNNTIVSLLGNRLELLDIENSIRLWSTIYYINSFFKITHFHSHSCAINQLHYSKKYPYHLFLEFDEIGLIDLNKEQQYSRNLVGFNTKTPQALPFLIDTVMYRGDPKQIELASYRYHDGVINDLYLDQRSYDPGHGQIDEAVHIHSFFNGLPKKFINLSTLVEKYFCLIGLRLIDMVRRYPALSKDPQKQTELKGEIKDLFNILDRKNQKFVVGATSRWETRACEKCKNKLVENSPLAIIIDIPKKTE